jgi:hypothetical protein
VKGFNQSTSRLINSRRAGEGEQMHEGHGLSRAERVLVYDAALHAVENQALYQGTT